MSYSGIDFVGYFFSSPVNELGDFLESSTKLNDSSKLLYYLVPILLGARAITLNLKSGLLFIAIYVWINFEA